MSHEAWQKRLAGTSVTVNAILPGPTFTEGLQEMLADAATVRAQRTPINYDGSLLKPNAQLHHSARGGRR